MTQAHRDPTLTFLDLATRHLSSRVADVLRDLQWTPKKMATGCGGAQSGWRSKMNGTRLFQLGDLVALTAATGTDMFTAVAIKTPDQLVPKTWQPHLTHRDQQIPLLQGPDQLWTDLGDTLADWLATETRAGRGPLVTRDVFLHHLLAALDARGTPSATATVAQGPSRTVLSWDDSRSTVAIAFRDPEPEDQERWRMADEPARWSFGNPYVAVSIVVAAGDERRQPRLISYALGPQE